MVPPAQLCCRVRVVPENIPPHMFSAVRPLQAPKSANLSGYIQKDRINVAEASEAVRCSLR
jgi:hypothetical protein